jgi:hypothetical protein
MIAEKIKMEYSEFRKYKRKLKEEYVQWVFGKMNYPPYIWKTKEEYKWYESNKERIIQDQHAVADSVYRYWDEMGFGYFF